MKKYFLVQDFWDEDSKPFVIEREFKEDAQSWCEIHNCSLIKEL